MAGRFLGGAAAFVVNLCGGDVFVAKLQGALDSLINRLSKAPYWPKPGEAVIMCSLRLSGFNFRH